MTDTPNEVEILMTTAAIGHGTTSSGRFLNEMVKERMSHFRKMSRLAPAPNRQRGYSKPKPWPSKVAR